MVLVWNGTEADPLLARLASTLWQLNQGEPLFHSIWANFNTSSGNAVLGQSFQLLHGEAWLWQVSFLQNVAVSRLLPLTVK